MIYCYLLDLGELQADQLKSDTAVMDKALLSKE